MIVKKLFLLKGVDVTVFCAKANTTNENVLIIYKFFINVKVLF